MAYRIRSIRPDVYERAGFDTASLLAQFLYLALPNLTDDEGRGHYLPRTIAGDIFPRKEEVDVAPALAELVEIGLIHRYEVDGRAYYHVPGWHEDQKPNRPQPSKLPAPDGYCSACTSAGNIEVKEPSIFTDESVKSERKFTEKCRPDHVMEGSGEDKERKGDHGADHARAREVTREPSVSRILPTVAERIGAALREDLFDGEIERLEDYYFGTTPGSFLNLPIAKANELASYLEHDRDRRQRAWAYVDGSNRVKQPYAFVRAALANPHNYPDVWGAPATTSIRPLASVQPLRERLSEEERLRRYAR